MKQIKALIPSVLSLVRLLLAVLFPFFSEPIWLWFVLAAGASDLLDGYLARRWQVQSWQGGIIDAVADKVFVLTVLLVYASVGKFAYWWILLVVSRDLMVLLTAVYAAIRRLWGSFRKMEVRVSGKLATGGQFALFVIALVLPQATGYALLFASFCSLLAAADYGRLFLRALAEQAAEEGGA